MLSRSLGYVFKHASSQQALRIGKRFQGWANINVRQRIGGGGGSEETQVPAIFSLGEGQMEVAPTTTSGLDYEFGWKFTPRYQNLIVTELSLLLPVVRAATVSLWDVATETILASAVVNTIAGEWASTEIDPIELSVGTTYLVSFGDSSESSRYDFEETELIVAPVIDYLSGALMQGVGNFPATETTAFRGIVGFNFSHTVAPELPETFETVITALSTSNFLDDGSTKERGTHFVVGASDVILVGVRIYPRLGTSHQIKLWDVATGGLLGYIITPEATTANSWNSYGFPETVLSAGQTYAVSVDGRSSLYSGAFGLGDVTTHAAVSLASNPGRQADRGVMPNESPANRAYGIVDFLFTQ